MNNSPHTPDQERRILPLVRDLEAEGYSIIAGRDGSAYFIIMSDLDLPEGNALDRFAVAIKSDPELKAAVLSFLLRHRRSDGTHPH